MEQTIELPTRFSLPVTEWVKLTFQSNHSDGDSTVWRGIGLLPVRFEMSRQLNEARNTFRDYFSYFFSNSCRPSNQTNLSRKTGHGEGKD